MRLRESLALARGQIAWILALVVSTGIIIQLERVDFQGRLSLLERNPLAGMEAGTGDAALESARAAYAQSPDDPLPQAQMLTALTLAALSDGPDALRVEARAVLAAVSPDSDNTVLNAAIALAETAFATR
ncbi:hypothetical protein [Alkalilacustris brevis]|uniref:hypothetical protein n=1 Tax=Alkalilacustris brevis TaxID=2026338 RepID=UPI000E0D879E|nr:hypothetical protein [Alkalilacustris brevis]